MTANMQLAINRILGIADRVRVRPQMRMRSCPELNVCFVIHSNLMIFMYISLQFHSFANRSQFKSNMNSLNNHFEARQYRGITRLN